MAKNSNKRSNSLLEYAARLRELVAVYKEALAASRGAKGGLLVTAPEARQRQTERVAERALELTTECADMLENVAPAFLGDPKLIEKLLVRLRAVRSQALAEQGSLGGKQSAKARAAIRDAVIESAVVAYLRLDADSSYAKDPFPIADIEALAGLEQGELRRRKITRKSIKNLADQRAKLR